VTDINLAELRRETEGGLAVEILAEFAEPVWRALLATLGGNDASDESGTVLFFTINNPSRPVGVMTFQCGEIATTIGCAGIFVGSCTMKGMSERETVECLSDGWTNGHFYAVRSGDKPAARVLGMGTR